MTTETPQPQQTPPASRRQFAKGIAWGAVAALGATAFAWWRARGQNFPRVAVATANEIPVGGSKIFTYPADTQPCILVHPDAATYAAYSRICTHTGCPVFYDAPKNVLYCPCHGGVFSVTDGTVLQGPPPRPLPRVTIERQGTELVATRVT